MSTARAARRASGPASALVLTLALLSGAARPGQGPKAEKGVEYWRAAASAYKIAPDAARATPLTFHDEPALRWTNPQRATGDGAVFLWTDRGRPEVAASFYRYAQGENTAEDHEFVSLATAPLIAQREGTQVWSPVTAGITPRPIPDAPKPGATAVERLRQMRALARDFKATFNLENDRAELRLLTQPLYRSEIKGRTDVTDGALFGFVQATDPEVLLLIEARSPDGKGEPTWHYAFARMSMVNLRGLYKDREVWNVEWDADRQNPSKPYLTRINAARRD